MKEIITDAQDVLNLSYLSVNRETKHYRSRLYLYNKNLFINLKSFIMRKTILTVTTACLLMVTGLQAEQRTNQNELTGITALKSVDISSFCKAIMQGDIETVKKLIELGENVNQKSLGMTPAIFAARYNKAEILELLIANGANLKIKADNGFTAKKYAELSNATDALAVLEAAMGS